MNSKKRCCRVWADEYGDGRGWCRGEVIGRGGYSCVFLASRKNTKLFIKNGKIVSFPSKMAAKSAAVFEADSLIREGVVLESMRDCPYIINYFGSETTTGKEATTYNLLLEYCSGGTLADKIKKSNCGLAEMEVKLFTLSILKGLCHIHESGYIHCDLKPENILLVPNKGRLMAKIADFGLALKAADEGRDITNEIVSSYKASQECVAINKKRKFQPRRFWRGTFDYMAPEAIVYGFQFMRSDIWSLGCIVLEMLTGKSAWKKRTDKRGKELSETEIFSRIRRKGELPVIPNHLSEDAKSFLNLCLVRCATDRGSAESLLSHSFFKGINV